MDERGDAEKLLVVQGHDRCQTYDAKWLCLENVYQKMYRPNMYDIGELDVECLKNKKLNISVKFFSKSVKGLSQDILDEVKSGHDFGALLDDPICSDFTIESADEHKFQVHKVILAAHSDVFKAMLKEETAESQNSYVKLVDVYGDDLRCILQFIYTGTVKDIMECNCSNLLMLADKYDLRGLVLLVEHALVQQMTVDTAAEILMIADLYNSDFLKTSVMKFIKKNPAVLKTSTWDEVNASLVRELSYIINLPIEISDYPSHLTSKGGAGTGGDANYTNLAHIVNH
ncbi:Protein roadkill [Eumeta japonica]|uniref:Protein roadkill n=1 Tax=Eumeta variegata TaxID=151549 RepID=A0A4C1T2A1_EUMVA|nr:Protein roadkill [Eumeta japonica]